jgi:hypothetical protein
MKATTQKPAMYLDFADQHLSYPSMKPFSPQAGIIILKSLASKPFSFEKWH